MFKKILMLVLIIIGLHIMTGCETEEKDVYLEKKTRYICNIGDELNSNNKCVRKIYNMASIRYICPDGYTGSGYCMKTGGVINLQKCKTYEMYYMGMCYPNVNATIEYYCQPYQGTLEGTMCVTEETYDPNIEFYCLEGYELTYDYRCKKIK